MHCLCRASPLIIAAYRGYESLANLLFGLQYTLQSSLLASLPFAVEEWAPERDPSSNRCFPASFEVPIIPNYLTKHTIESSNRMHSFCIYNLEKKNDTGILRRRKRMQPSAISSMRQEARSTFRTGCQAPECEGNWSRSFCKPLSATNSCNIHPHYDTLRH